MAGGFHQPNYSFSLFGQANPIGLKSLLATVALGLAVVQVLLALRYTGSYRSRGAHRALYGGPIGSWASGYSRLRFPSPCTA